MKPKFNFWLKQDGRVTLSIWRVKLLEAIDQAGSISGGKAELIVMSIRVICFSAL